MCVCVYVYVWRCRGGEVVGKHLYFLLNFCEPKTAVKNAKIILNIEKNMERDSFLSFFIF